MELKDLDLLHAWENASEDWWMGATLAPMSREAMRRFVTGDHDLYRDRQLRWMLDVQRDDTWTTVGAIDLYDFDPRHLRAGVAIFILEAFRRSHHGTLGLQIMKSYANQHLGLHQLYAEIPARHDASTRLFQGVGFSESSVRKQWIRDGQGEWRDVVTWQCIFQKPEAS